MQPTQAKQILISLAAATMLSISTGARAEFTLGSAAEQSTFVAEQELQLSASFWEAASSRISTPALPGTVVAVQSQQLRSNQPERRRSRVTPV